MRWALALATASAALMVSTPVAAADKVGRCLAVMDGAKRFDAPCIIHLEPGGGFEIGEGDTFRVAPDRVDGAATGSATVTWSGFDRRTDKSFTQTIAALRRDGACWANGRGKICAWDGAAELQRNRGAPYTAFHPLVGQDVLSRCHMGECEWFRFETARLVDHNAREALYELRERRWNIEYPDADYDKKGTRQDDDTQRIYVRCSRERPAMMWRFKPAGAWTIFNFAPAGSGLSGASWFVNAQYAAACHGRTEVLSAAAGTLLGYPADAAANVGDGGTIDKPAEALKPD